MTKDQIQSFINSYLSKQAEEGPAHEAAETPNAEMLEHAVGVGGEEQPHGTGPGGVDVEQILSQLSPEELQELIAQLTQAEGAPAAGEDDVAGLSQNIESHLAQNPEAQVPGMEPEKAAALDFVKSAHYIEGFIKQALDYGLEVDQAVNMYDSALTTTVDTMKKEAADKNMFQKGLQKARIGAKKSVKAVSKAYRGAADGVRRNLAGATAGAQEHIIANKGKYSAGAGALGGAAIGYAAGKSSDDEKQAAYLEGIFKQAVAYGFTEDEAYEVVKEAADKNMFQKGLQKARIGAKKGLKAVRDTYNKATTKSAPKPPALSSGEKTFKEKAHTAVNALKDKATRGYESASSHVARNKGKYIGGAALAGGAAAYAAGKSSDKEKKAAYLEGIFKQAMAYGFSEAEAVQFAQQAEASL
jgi:hypothetical protein